MHINSLMFSIIVPTYNEESDIRQTLESLVALHWSNKEIIIVDDSNDACPRCGNTELAYIIGD